MKTKKHLFKGSISKENDIYVARDVKEHYLDWGKTIVDCQKSIFNCMKLLYPNTPFIVEYYKKTGYWNFSAYKRGRDNA